MKIAPSASLTKYFYPDLPKNYQISQYDLPIAEHGWLEIELVDADDNLFKRIGITRLHMEEDAGKLVHAGSDRLRFLLLTGRLQSHWCPLVEIVSEPDMRSGQEAAEYAQELRRILRYLGVSDGNMQVPPLRCQYLCASIWTARVWHQSRN